MQALRSRPPVRLHGPVYPVPTPRAKPPVCLPSLVSPVPAPRTRPPVCGSSAPQAAYSSPDSCDDPWHEASSGDPWHEASGDDPWHEASSDDSWHEASGDDPWHEASGDDLWHKASSEESWHEASHHQGPSRVVKGTPGHGRRSWMVRDPGGRLGSIARPREELEAAKVERQH